MTFIVCFSSVNIYAAENDNMVVVDDGNEENIYDIYNYEGKTWQSYIDYLKSIDVIDEEFKYYDEYVIYKGDFLINSNGEFVKPSDIVKLGNEEVYSVSQSYTLSMSYLTFNKEFSDLDINFLEFNQYFDYDNDFTFYAIAYPGYTMTGYAEVDVYYQSRLLQTANYATVKTHYKLSDSPAYAVTITACSHSDQTVSQRVMATCTKPGYQIWICKTCGCTFRVDVSENDTYGHRYTTEYEVLATCFEDGYYKLVCKECGDVVEGINPMLEHLFTNATCTDASYCFYCHTLGNEAALGHNFQGATCKQLGKCTRCGEKGTEYASHDFNWLNRCKVCNIRKRDVKPDNCTVHDFNWINKCKNCGVWFRDAELPACEGEHEFSILGRCKNCGIWRKDVKEDKTTFWDNLTDSIKGDEDGQLRLNDVWRVLLIVLCIIPVICLVYIVTILAIKIKNKGKGKKE